MVVKDTELYNIKILLDIKDNTKDEKLLLYMENAEQMILDVTNRTELLDSMASILRDLTISLYNANSSSSNGISYATGAVKRITEGEQTVEFETQSGGTTSTISSNGIPISIMSRLARYKRNKVCLYDRCK